MLIHHDQIVRNIDLIYSSQQYSNQMQAQNQENFIERKPEQIYSSADNNQKLSYFLNSNRIISSTHIVRQFLNNFHLYAVEKQEKLLNELINALKSVTTNSYFLNEQQRVSRKNNLRESLQGNEQQKTIIAMVIDLLMKNVKNYVIFNLLVTVLDELLPYSSLDDSLLQSAISKVVIHYYDKKVYGSELFATASLFKSYFHAKITAQKDPISMLAFHGSNKLEIFSNKKQELTWILKQGFTLFFWINLQNIKSGSEVSLPKLFTFYAPQVGGIESYLIDNKIYYRILGNKYTEPQIGSNGLLIGQIEYKKWIFVCFEHEGSHVVKKSKLKCHINKNKPNVVGLDPPKISSSAQTKYIFFDKIYCKTSSICLIPNLVSPEIIEDHNKHINSCQNIKIPKVHAFVFEARQGKVYERSGFGSSHNYIFQRNLEMNFQLILPLFYLLRYQQKDQNYPTLNELLSTFVHFLRKSSQNQTEAVKNGYFRAISQLICDVKKNVFDDNTIKSILYIKHTITDPTLLDQYFSDFLWPFVESNIPIIRKQQILQIIKNAFTQNIAHYSSQIGLDQMINALQNLQGSLLTCCQKHFKIASNKFQRSLEGIHHFGEEKKAQGYILSLIQNTFQNSKIHYAHEIYKLCRLLCLKFSPCFFLQLMSLIKRLLTQKFNQRMSESQIKQIAKYFQEKNVQQIFLHVIQNNFFAEIKAESVKLIYTLLIKKSSVQQSYISHLISKSLWKINEFADQKEQTETVKPQQRKSSQKLQLIQKKPLLEPMQSEEQQFILVGPQAPALSNRLKGKKSFDFGFVNEVKSKLIRQIMQQQKTTEPETFSLPIINNPSKKKDKKKFLSINTEAINEMYTFGGEKGQQIIISEDQQQNQLEKIIKLAKKCVSAMNGKAQETLVHLEQRKKPAYVPPPMTTKNKAVVAKKTFNLNLISEQEQEAPVKIPTPLATKKSNKTPTSIKSSNEQNVFTLYNSLLECCLGVSFQTCLISNSKIQVPSILNIFFKWIPQTDLETKFLNDLDIILESNQNMALVVELPQLYDFLFELSYKCLLFEQMKEKRVYTQKLENIIKLVFSYVYKQDLSGFSKFSFILNWTQSKKSQQYEPKCLFLTSRYTILLMLECIQELLIMNNTNDQVMQRNFQSIAIVIETLKKITHEQLEEISVDQCQRVVFVSDIDLPPSLVPYFKSNWVDFILYQKYLFLFRRFYCTQWYKGGLKNFATQQVQLIDFLRKTNLTVLQREATYYMKSNFLVSLIQIQRAMLIQMKLTQPKQVYQIGMEAVWQTILLVILAEFSKQKFIKSQKSQFILTFLKSCKLLSQKQVQKIVQIVPMLSIVKHCLSFSSIAGQQPQKLSVSTQILDDIINNYIPEYLLNMGKTDLESFNLNFNQVWIPNQNHYKKIHSEMFMAYKEKIKKEEQINFIQFVSNILEEENERRQYTNVLIEAFNRIIRNNYRKLWYSLRIYNQLWTHPQLKWQEDRLFTKTIYAYQRYQPSPFFKYKVSKQFSRGKGRYFLKPKLIDPQFVKEKPEKSYNASNQYNLEKALKDLNQKIILGVSKRIWISSKVQEGLYFMSDFKRVRIINTLTYRSGYLSLINDNLVFISSVEVQKQSHLSIDQYKLRSDKTLHKLWPLQYIRQIYKRRYVNRKKSVQINFIYNKSVIFDFENEEQAEQFCKKIMKLKNKCINLIFSGKSLDPKKLIQSQQYSKKWMSYDLTTFDYLMQLNTLAGRSHSDLTQYPVFPWVLKNFNEQKCLLNDENSIRKLALPMGANGTQERIHNFQERYEVMHMQDQFATKFHYGTHYSSPGIIYHFLVRLSPYTQGSILLQSGRFDFADRLFFSLADSYKNATAQYSDVRELIPEMYSIPQTYLNVNGLDLGVMQNKKRVNNVELPQWCNQNPYIFIYYMRKGLEQKTCSSQIHNWIDLIFGYKQRGQQAVKALNCFYYLTYQDAIPWDHFKNQKDIQSIESQVVNFGQTPSQIFTKPHQQRNHSQNFRNFRAICDPEAEPKVYRPSKSNQQKTGDQKLNPMKQSDESIIFMKWISQSKVLFIRRSGQIIFYKCFPNANPATKIPFQCTIQKEKRVQRIKKLQFDPNQYYDPSLEVLNFPIELIGNGHTVCLGGLNEGKLVLIDIDTGGVIYSYQNHGKTISCIKSDPRQNFLMTGDITGKVIMWQIKPSNYNTKLVQKKVIKDQKAQITSIFFSNELQCVAIASMDGSVFVYNMITGKKLRVYYHQKRLPIDQVVLTSNPLAAVILFCNNENTIYSYSLNGQLIARSHEKTFEYFLSPALMKDSKSFQYLAYGNEKSQISFRQLPFLSIPTKNSFKVAKDASVNKISVSKYSRFLFSGCSDGELTVITDPFLLNNS